ncbi:hypothetical protein Cgig2_026245 [Carnegiea gigantea]|uniref:Uncharacterized protein n=1 Tax=Carnegiea gigantea TaxID=171969 RepID=A0A9Q1QI58_9CARY|nr:hypothetical protein Cgig2_026245 [Carnegiea gigantea]
MIADGVFIDGSPSGSPTTARREEEEAGLKGSYDEELCNATMIGIIKDGKEHILVYSFNNRIAQDRVVSSSCNNNSQLLNTEETLHYQKESNKSSPTNQHCHTKFSSPFAMGWDTYAGLCEKQEYLEAENRSLLPVLTLFRHVTKMPKQRYIQRRARKVHEAKPNELVLHAVAPYLKQGFHLSSQQAYKSHVHHRTGL